MLVAQMAVWLLAQPAPTDPPPPSGLPNPTGPDAPPELKELVTKFLNFGWFSVLAVAFAMAMWGLGSLAWSSKKQQFGGVNEGKKTTALAIAGAAGMTVLRGVFTFFGV